MFNELEKQFLKFIILLRQIHFCHSHKSCLWRGSTLVKASVCFQPCWGCAWCMQRRGSAFVWGVRFCLTSKTILNTLSPCLKQDGGNPVLSLELKKMSESQFLFTNCSGSSLSRAHLSNKYSVGSFPCLHAFTVGAFTIPVRWPPYFQCYFLPWLGYLIRVEM